MEVFEAGIKCQGGIMASLKEVELKRLIKGGETSTVELKLAALI